MKTDNEKQEQQKARHGKYVAYNYLQQKSSRKFPDLNKLKPSLHASYPSSMHYSMFENPIFENYLTNYMEETQSKINNAITFDQFKTIFWEKGFPNFIIEFLCCLTGQREKVFKFCEEIQDLITQKTRDDLNKFIVKNPFNLQDEDRMKFNEIFNTNPLLDDLEDVPENMNQLMA